jgi:cyclic dehypoxanthinyl futalosine synthase
MKEPFTHNTLKERIYQGQRIASVDASALYAWDLHDLAMAADMRRKAIFPTEEVGFVYDRIINFTNICEAGCAFCAFHAKAGRVEPYELNLDEICNRIESLITAGGTQVMLQGGLHPQYTLDNYVQLVYNVKKRFPGIYLHSFSPAELVHASKKSSVPLDEVIISLKNAGLDSVPGASDLLVDRIRKKISPKKLTVKEWIKTMEALHFRGFKSSATMTYGMGETDNEQIEHLAVIRDLQDRTGMIRAFIPWSFSPARTRMSHISPATGIQYLKIVAIARIFLDNIIHIQAGWLTEGLKLAQIVLAMGATDMGGVLTEELVVKATGLETRTTRNELIDIIKNAGKIPVQRNSEYRVIRSFSENPQNF